MGRDNTSNLQAASTIGTLLVAGHQHDDDLAFDLYGDWSEEDGCIVETVMIAGTQHNVTSLLSGKQLEDLGHYLDRRASTNPLIREQANVYRSQSTRY